MKIEDLLGWNKQRIYFLLCYISALLQIQTYNYGSKVTIKKWKTNKNI